MAITRPLISDPFEAQELGEHVRQSLSGGSSMRMEVDAGGAAILLRTLPLVVHGAAAGAAMLIRDVTEVKRRDRALLSKDATIREIHHRVKNNLQTVAALLRLQARRMNNEEGREALMESVRRVASIAQVHEALSMSVDEEVNLDEVIDRILPIMNDVASVDAPIRIIREGALGVLDADRATALIMVITELVQNAIEHAFEPSAKQGCVTIRAERSARWLDVVVHDDGRGMPEGFSLEKSDRLGLQIVRTLVSTELDGSLGMHDVADGEPTWCCGCRSAAGQARACRNSKCDADCTHAKSKRPRHLPGPFTYVLRSGVQTPLRARVRALRRLSARRSSSLMPPQTPASWPESKAQLKHSVVTGHRLQTSFASAICARAGPLFPTGKNNSGSSSRQTALWRQSICRYSLTVCAAERTAVYLRLLTRAHKCFCTVASDRFTASTDVKRTQLTRVQCHYGGTLPEALTRLY